MDCSGVMTCTATPAFQSAFISAARTETDAEKPTLASSSAVRMRMVNLLSSCLSRLYVSEPEA
jgi:hypothetical protein